jgi:hypothetical protein
LYFLNKLKGQLIALPEKALRFAAALWRLGRQGVLTLFNAIRLLIACAWALYGYAKILLKELFAEIDGWIVSDQNF